MKSENIKKIVQTKKPILDEKKVKQESEFEKKEKLDLNEIAALIDKKKENLAETKKDSIINLFCIESIKEEMSKANLNYDEKIAKDTCDCYLREFLNSTSHQNSIDKCKLEAKKKFNL